MNECRWAVEMLQKRCYRASFLTPHLVLPYWWLEISHGGSIHHGNQQLLQSRVFFLTNQFLSISQYISGWGPSNLHLNKPSRGFWSPGVWEPLLEGLSSPSPNTYFPPPPVTSLTSPSPTHRVPDSGVCFTSHLSQLHTTWFHWRKSVFYREDKGFSWDPE